jgi:molecular chaperone DnaK
MKSDYKDKMSEEDAKAMTDAIEAAKKVSGDDKADKDALESAGKELNDKIMPIGAKMYEAANAETPSEDAAKSDDKKSDDDTIEGEVVDDKK